MTRELAIKIFNEVLLFGKAHCTQAEFEELAKISIQALEQEPCEDCISRKAVDRIINKWLSHPNYELKDHIYSMTEKIHNLPTVTPQEPILDKIRAEIEQLSTSTCTETRRIYIDAEDFKENVLAILNKYKAETEEKE